MNRFQSLIGICLIVLSFFMVQCGDSFLSNTSYIKLTTTGLDGQIQVTLYDKQDLINTYSITSNGTVLLENFFPEDSIYYLVLGDAPSGQFCELNEATGTAEQSITLTLTCQDVGTNYTVGGVVTGLDTGESIGLLLNSGEAVTATGGTFTFTAGLPDERSYEVTVYSDGLGKTCSVYNESGTIDAANVSNVMVSCRTINLLFNHDEDFNGGMGGRTGADNFCSDRADEISATNCDQVHAFISVSSSDQIVDFPENYSIRSDLDVYAYNHFRNDRPSQIGENWADILDGTWDGSVFTWPRYDWTWSGSKADGTVASETCQGFTRANSQVSGKTFFWDIGQTGSFHCAATLALVCGCLNDGYQLGGSVDGLTGTVVLRVTDGDAQTEDLTLVADGNFYFNGEFNYGDDYSVEVLTQPTGQTCTLEGEVGTIDEDSYQDLTVTCEDDEVAENTISYLFPSDGVHTGDIGGRTEADTICSTTKSNSFGDLTCNGGVRAFITVDSSDSIANMPTNYSVNEDNPIHYTTDGTTTTKIADDWTDLLDGTIDASIDVDWWSGADTDGGDSGFNCSSWTVADGSSASIGDSGETDMFWIDDSGAICTESYSVLCLCY